MSELTEKQTAMLHEIVRHVAKKGEPRPAELLDKRILKALVNRKLVLERKKGIVPSKAGLKLAA